MSIEWNPSYERLSSDKLRLLGIRVVKEFENGIRVIETDNYTYRLVNISDNKLREFEFWYATEYPRLGLFELGKSFYKIAGHTMVDTYDSVVFNSHGEIVIMNMNPDGNLSSMEEFYTKNIDIASKAIDFLEERIKNNYSPDEKMHDNVYWDRYLDINEHGKDGRYLTVKLNYDFTFGAVLVYDREEEKTILKSTASLYKIKTLNNDVECSEDIKELKDYAVLIVTSDTAIAILDNQSSVYQLESKSLQQTQRINGAEPEFLDDFRKAETLIESELEQHLNEIIKKQIKL